MNDAIFDLKHKITAANKAYREGNTIMSDIEFDTLCEELQKLLSIEEWAVFRSTLFETAGKVKHPYAMGSLSKMKYEEPEAVCTWINEHVENALNVSAKVDGISLRVRYENGKIVSGTTRGNGTKGENVTDKILVVRSIPHEIDLPGIIDIRGELVMFENDFEEYADKYANPRNFVAGIFGRKEITNDLSKISFVAYTIFGKQFTKKEQFEILERNRFTTAWHKSFPIAELQVKTARGFQNFNDELRSYVKQRLPYGIDGLVLSDDDYRNENVLIPEGQVAFKVNESTAETTVIDVQWGEPSKNGRLSPVAILEKVEIAGTSVSHATLNNLDFIEKMGVKYGSKVLVSKQGEIIPTIVKVLENPENTVEIIPPSNCPICNAPLMRDGVDLRCENPKCGSKQLAEVTSFIRKFDVKHSAKKQLDNFGIKTIDDLIAFLPNQKYKSEVTLYNEICEKIFTASPKKIFCAMNFKGLAEIQLGKILDKYSFDWIMNLKLLDSEKKQMLSDLPVGIGEKSIEIFWNSLFDAIENTRKILLDSRHHYDASKTKEFVKNDSSKGSICFTGTLDSMGRKEAQKLAESVGFEVKNGVNRGLTYLVIADPNSQSSKANKAREFGTKLLSEKEFLDMCKCEEQNLDNL